MELKASWSGNETPFIVTTVANPSDEKTRRLIRSHVMRGKNRKKRSLRIFSSKFGNEMTDVTRFSHQIPPRIGGAFPAVGASTEVEPEMLEMICKFNEAVSPFQFTLTSHETKLSSLEPVLTDAACFHFTAFIATRYFDFLRGREDSSKTTLAHFGKALDILQRRLGCSNDPLYSSDSTILVVIGFTMTAIALGDFDSAFKHVNGLRKMVLLRGGISVFKENIQLQTKILRTDLEVALSTGSRPLFFSEAFTGNLPDAAQWRMLLREELSSDSDLHTQTNIPGISHNLDCLDLKLQVIWDDIFEFVRAANYATQHHLSIDSGLLQRIMLSIHYRLFDLGFKDHEYLNEAVRLVLSAFSCTIFLQWRGVKTRYEYLAQGIKRNLILLEDEPTRVPPHLNLWIHVIAVVFVFDENERTQFQASLIKVLGDLGVGSWDDLRSLLQSILWLNVLHDFPTMQFMNSVLFNTDSKPIANTAVR